MIYSNYRAKRFVHSDNDRKIGKNNMIISYISLFVMFSVLATTTFSWFTQKDTATINTGAITVSATAGLRVNHGEDLSGLVKLATGVKLAEASSVDGRNMFFPTTGTFSSKTSEMVFRDGNVGDRNVNYFYSNFKLKSDSGDTDVYVKSYEIVVNGVSGTQYKYSSTISETGTVECPVRIAFIEDSCKTPVVIDPTAAVKDYCRNYDAVSSVDVEGKATTQKTAVHSFAEYYYSTGNPIFRIPNNNPLELTMAIWLEGTGGNCNEFVGQNISIKVEFESNWEHMDNIKFIDDTVGDTDENVKNWINTDGCLVTVTYYDVKTAKSKTMPMIKSASYNSDHTWTASIPDYVTTDIRFNRYMPTDAVVWNAWYTKVGVNNETSNWVKEKIGNKLLQETRCYTSNSKTYRSLVYRAKRGNGYSETDNQNERLSPCIGYWDESGGKLDDSVTTVPTQPTTTPTTAPTTAPASEPSSMITINVAFTDNTNEKTIYGNAISNDSLYMVFDDGTDAKMIPTVNSDGSASNYFETKGISVSSSAKIERFEMRNIEGKAYDVFPLSNSISVSDGDWCKFTIDYAKNIYYTID